MSEPAPHAPVAFLSPRFLELLRVLTWLLVLPAFDASVNRFGLAGLCLPPLLLVFVLFVRLLGHRRRGFSEPAPYRFRAPVWRLSFAVIAVVVAVYVWTDNDKPFGLVRYGGLWVAGLQAGELDRLVSAWWLHVNRAHLLSNIGPLWLALSGLERRHGVVQTIATVGSATLLAAPVAVAALVLAPNTAYIAGASLVWAVASGAYVFGADREADDRTQVLRWALVLNVVVSSFGSGVGAAAHMAGFAAGAWLSAPKKVASAVLIVNAVALGVSLLRATHYPPSYEAWVTSVWARRATKIDSLLDLADAYALSAVQRERAVAEELARRALVLDPGNPRAQSLLRTEAE